MGDSLSRQKVCGVMTAMLGLIDDRSMELIEREKEVWSVGGGSKKSLQDGGR